MFAGEHINTTEDRAVLHVALRMPRDSRPGASTGGTSVATCTPCSTQWARVAERIRSGAWTGATGRRIDAVVNIGIGGSDLGPAMAHEALLATTPTRPSVSRFVSNVDPVDLYAATHDLDPASHAVRGQLEDLHHPGDADQRPGGPGLAARRPRQPGRGGGPALRRRVHQRGRRRRVRDRPRQHVRVLGLGRRPLLLRLGHRVLADGGHRAGGLRRDARRVPHRRPRTSPTRPSRRTSRSSRGCSTSGTTTCSAPRPTPCCPTASAWPASRPTCSS